MSRSAEQTQDSPHLWPAARRRMIQEELLQGKDTVAGIARRDGLPVQTLLAWSGPNPGETLFAKGISPLQSRIAGDC